jgi:hypothetical protein
MTDKMISSRGIYSSIILGALSILLIVFFIVPIFRQIAGISQDFYSQKNELAYLNEEKNNLKKIENIYQTYQSDLDKIENLFFDPEVPIGFIAFLEKTAADCQIKLEISSMVKKTEKEDTWPSLSVQLLTTGSFTNSSKFLEKLENSPYLIEILDLNVRKLAGKEASTGGLANIPEPDTAAILSIKVFTK